ncbi:MAG: hypothetical protein EZS28_018602, partial [Streblomastix strix]
IVLIPQPARNTELLSYLKNQIPLEIIVLVKVFIPVIDCSFPVVTNIVFFAGVNVFPSIVKSVIAFPPPVAAPRVAITLLISGGSVSYSRSEIYVWDEVNAKGEDDVFLLLKADKTQLIDSYRKSETYARNEVLTKTETKTPLNNKNETAVSYSKSEIYASDDVQTKDEDDTLLLAKVGKKQLIDSYSKSETYARDEVFPKTETNNLLNDKANQSITYTKTENDQLISQIDTGDVDFSNYNINTKTKTEELLDEKTNSDFVAANFLISINLANYVISDTSWTITANKPFNKNCRFISSIDGMSTVTGSSFIKSGADNIVILLGAGGTKPIAEFCGSVDDMNYVKKIGYATQSIQKQLNKY